MDTDSDAALQLQSLGDLLSEVVAQLPRQPDQRRVPTGFTDLDAVTGGLAPGSLWVISGRSGAGKSVLVSDLVRSAAARLADDRWPTAITTATGPATWDSAISTAGSSTSRRTCTAGRSSPTREEVVGFGELPTDTRRLEGDG